MKQTKKSMQRRRAPLLKITKKLEAVKVGCSNNANCCYMNALLQSLHNVTTFKHKIMAHTQIGSSIINILKNIFNALDTKQGSNNSFSWYINPTESGIYQETGFNQDVQSDPHEVFVQLMCRIEEEDSTITDEFMFDEIKEIPEHNNTNTMRINVFTINTPIDDTDEEETYKIDELLNEQMDYTEEKDGDRCATSSRTTHKINQNILCLHFGRIASNGNKKLYTRYTS